MKQEAIKSIHGAIRAGQLALNGATALGATIGLADSTQAVINQDLTALITAHGLVEKGKTVLETRRSALAESGKACHAYVLEARDALKPKLGYQHNDMWTVAGFVRSLQVPRTTAGLMPIVETLRIYFTDNATLEVAPRNVTAARATALIEEVNSAENALTTQIVALRNLRKDRQAKVDAMKERISKLVKELGHRLAPTDVSYLQFGLNIPGAVQIPEIPADVLAVLISGNAAAVKWSAAARASHYRVWKRVIGVDTEFVAAGSPADLDFVVEQLPANAQVEIAVSAVNSGGESAKSVVVTVQTA